MIGPDYDHFCSLTLSRSGLVLTGARTHFVQSRLDPIARKHGLADVPALLARLRSGAPDSLQRACVDAMANHESLFFRDAHPFQTLAAILPEVVAPTTNRPLRVWVAGCAGGQEAYSIAMQLQEETFRLRGRRVEIIATDMAEAIVNKARSGLYSDLEVQQGLSIERRDRWMARRGDHWEIAPALKAMVSFRRHNLLDGVIGMGLFEVVFCRNVLVALAPAKKIDVLANIAKVMVPGAALFLGASETVTGLSEAFEQHPERPSVYRPRRRFGSLPHQSAAAS